MSAFAAIGAIVAAYLCGSLPSGLLIARARGVDIREVGSGNIGATNVARTLGKPLGVLVLLIDAVKGFLPVFLCRRAWLDVPHGPEVIAAAGLAAILGHVFPIWLKLHGGKGVATALGVLVVLVPLAALAGALVYAGLVAAWRVSSIGSLAGGVTAVLIAALTARAPEYAWLSALLFALILWTHRSNIQRILRRTERRF